MLTFTDTAGKPKSHKSIPSRRISTSLNHATATSLLLLPTYLSSTGCPQNNGANFLGYPVCSVLFRKPVLYRFMMMMMTTAS